MISTQGPVRVVHCARRHADEDGYAAGQLHPKRLSSLEICVGAQSKRQEEDLENDVKGWQHVRVNVHRLVVHLAERFRAHTDCHLAVRPVTHINVLLLNKEELFDAFQLFKAVDHLV